MEESSARACEEIVRVCNGVSLEVSALQKHRSTIDKDRAESDFERAQDEWECIDGIVPLTSSCLSIPKVETQPISYGEALEYFRNRDMSPYLTNIIPVMDRSRFSSIVRIILGPAKLCPSLENDRNLVFAIACCPLDNSEAVQLHILHTIYNELTKAKRDYPRFGPHWEEIGFQGNDPATDLRGVGCLGLMHLLYLVTNPNTLPLAQAIFKLSHHQTQNFPFCVMGLNISKIVLQVLREEKLNKECNSCKDVFETVNKFYVAVFLILYESWRKNRVTIEKTGWLLRDLESSAIKKPKTFLTKLEKHIVESNDNIRPNVTRSNPSGAQSVPRLYLEEDSNTPQHSVSEIKQSGEQLQTAGKYIFTSDELPSNAVNNAFVVEESQCHGEATTLQYSTPNDANLSAILIGSGLNSSTTNSIRKTLNSYQQEEIFI